ncbi:ABC transporter ATP-binding protein [Paenibacillus sp. SYP-B4298]|uniref:ABC transporter ATP-binding protein n=1 Tax=Paenibacillus sp. SYP-B4298 TaxID=2996034 RepID=UPI0022DD6CE9|nr:ABC transporter ATP-binding protein [Paenibacillus sp. SYP-B4298]
MKVAHLISHAKELGHILSFMSKGSKIRYFTGISLSTTIQSLFLVSFSLVVQGLVDFAVTQDTSLMYRAILILAGSLFLVNFVAPGFSYMFRSSVERTMADIRERLFVKLCKLRPSYLEQTHNGDILSRMNNDVTTLEVTYTGVYFVLLLQFVFGVGSLVTMFVIHWPFACASLAILLISFAISARFIRQIRLLSEQSLKLLARMTEKFSDFIGGIQLVKLFHIQPIYAQYASLNEQVTSVATQTARKNGMLSAVNHFVSYVTFCGIIATGSLFYTYGLIGMGTVAALAVLQINLTHAIMNLGTVLSMAQNSLAGAQRLQQLLDEQEEPEHIGAPLENEASRKTSSSPAMVELQRVDFSYSSGKKVLNEVSLRVAPGQIAAIVGSSGSGKSTLIKLLLGFYPIDSGALLIQGKPLGQYTLDELRACIAYVPQDAFLFSGTIEENIRYGNPQATEEEIIAAAKAAYAHHFIEELPERYQTQVGERGKSLSGGQRQRIAIARALLKNAPILLLDEATSALDSESEYWVQQALDQLMEGRTTILIAHQLSTVERADLIMVMSEGTVVEQGTYRELLEQGGHFATLYGSMEASSRG